MASASTSHPPLPWMGTPKLAWAWVHCGITGDQGLPIRQAGDYALVSQESPMSARRHEVTAAPCTRYATALRVRCAWRALYVRTLDRRRMVIHGICYINRAFHTPVYQQQTPRLIDVLRPSTDSIVRLVGASLDSSTKVSEFTGYSAIISEIPPCHIYGVFAAVDRSPRLVRPRFFIMMSRPTIRGSVVLTIAHTTVHRPLAFYLNNTGTERYTGLASSRLRFTSTISASNTTVVLTVVITLAY